jgi:thymidylate synthase (FAD)
MECQLIAWTEFPQGVAINDAGEQFRTDAYGGGALAEFAGRACYQSWNKPNPATATNASYLAHIIDVGHFSVLEHANATFYIDRVSRSLTHEFVRHRHFSYSQLSQRFVDESQRREPVVVPPEFRGGQDWQYTAQQVINTINHQALLGYDELLEILRVNRPDLPRKEARQAARAVLPNATETKFVVTGNMRAWREWLEKRGAQPADREIRELAVRVYWALVSNTFAGLANMFQDFRAVTFADGTGGVLRKDDPFPARAANQ